MKRSFVLCVVLVCVAGVTSFAENTGDCEITLLIKELNGAAGPSVVVSRVMSREQVPFVVEYSYSLPEGFSLVEWSCSDSDCLLWSKTGNSQAGFALNSNASPISFSFVLADPSGDQYEWVDEDIEFFLYNETEILLDGHLMFPNTLIDTAVWGGSSFDPADASTFPIAGPNSPVTSMYSVWPNTLVLTCDALAQDGSIMSNTVEALIYWDDGSPWEIRSIYAPAGCGFIVEDRDAILTEIFPILEDVGYTHVTHQQRWFYDAPNADGQFDIHPVYDCDTPIGSTTPLAVLAEYIVAAQEAGFGAIMEIRPAPYQSVASAQDYHASGYGPHAGFLNSDEWLFGEAGLRNMFLTFTEFINDSNIDMVCLGSEQGWVIEDGGEVYRSFYSELLNEYRAAGVSADLFYASSDFWDNEWKRDALLDPAVCGIPYQEMDLVSVTSYVPLGEPGQKLSTEEMRENALAYILDVHYPFHKAYERPFFIEDMICHAIAGSSTSDPIATQSGQYAPDEQLRWYAAWLRALGEANSWESQPWIAGITAASYRMLPDSVYQGFEPTATWNDWVHPRLNSVIGLRGLHNLLKVFMRDVPIESASESCKQEVFLQPTPE